MTHRERREMRADLALLVTSRASLKHVRGQRGGGEPADEREHFYVCAVCGQSVDKRSLLSVIHHKQSEHEPLPVN